MNSTTKPQTTCWSLLVMFTLACRWKRNSEHIRQNKMQFMFESNHVSMLARSMDLFLADSCNPLFITLRYAYNVMSNQRAAFHITSSVLYVWDKVHSELPNHWVIILSRTKKDYMDAAFEIMPFIHEFQPIRRADTQYSSSV